MRRPRSAPGTCRRRCYGGVEHGVAAQSANIASSANDDAAHENANANPPRHPQRYEAPGPCAMAASRRRTLRQTHRVPSSSTRAIGGAAARSAQGNRTRRRRAHRHTGGEVQGVMKHSTGLDGEWTEGHPVDRTKRQHQWHVRQRGGRHQRDKGRERATRHAATRRGRENATSSGCCEHRRRKAVEREQHPPEPCRPGWPVTEREPLVREPCNRAGAGFLATNAAQYASGESTAAEPRRARQA